MSFPEQFRFSDASQAQIQKMLEAHGFSLPHGEWLTLKLSDIEHAYQWSAWRRDKDHHEANIKGWKEIASAMSIAINYLDREGPELCSPTISDAMGRIDVWSDEPLDAVWVEEDYEKHLVPAPFSEEDIALARRVMVALHGSASDLSEGLEKWFNSRPVKNDKPEINGLIRGLTRLWCAAFKTPVANVRISASAGSPVMNFIETSVELFLGKSPSRASIETHVIAYREEEKAKLS
ncbi:hypothetical protein MPL3356_390141 [Mesorhizobium plurifarium]|uniref:Uncharacterized protein n=1 Tax=Mesorhizobium plurifarium TaxID=69974 RepID=A0A090DYB1_MESPL|nr:hypothetical protein MPL3356_390141 [Mesorhizobium plurifarium]